MYSIIGVTGHVGSVAAKELLKKGHSVRAVLRNPEKAEQWIRAGAEIAIADLNNEDSLTKALQGTEAVFVMTPPLFDSQNPLGEHLKMLENIFAAVQRSGIQHVVYLSSIGAHLSHGTGAILKLYDMEKKLRQLSVSTVGIRAGWFMENFDSSFEKMLSEGQLYSFIDPLDLKIPMVAAKDIGQQVASLLQEKRPGHQLIELGGPSLYSVVDLVTIVEEQTGKSIAVSAIPMNDYHTVYSSFGFTDSAADLMAEMNVGFNSRHICFEEQEDIAQISGKTSLEDFIREKIRN